MSFHKADDVLLHTFVFAKVEHGHLFVTLQLQVEAAVREHTSTALCLINQLEHLLAVGLCHSSQRQAQILGQCSIVVWLRHMSLL